MPTTEDYQAAIAKNRQDIGQRFADIPNVESRMRESLFGGDQVLGTLRGQESDKIKELFDHDKSVAAQYQTPPAAGQILDPYIRETQLTNRYRGTMEDLTGIRSNIATRRDVLGSALEKGMKMLMYGLEAAKFEHTSLQDELTNQMKLDEMKQRNSERGAGQADKTSRSKALAEAIQYLLTQTGNRGEAQQDIAAIVGKNPSIAEDALGLLKLFPETEKFGFGLDESAAGVAGQPKTPENVQKFQGYAAGQKEPSDVRKLRLLKQQKAEQGPNFLQRLFGGATSPPTATPPTPTASTKGATSNTAERARQAQQAIDTSADRQGTYERIITAEPDLIPYVKP